MEPSTGNKSICLPFRNEAHYQACLADKAAFRQYLEELHRQHPELFPTRFGEGFQFYGSYWSVKQQVDIVRLLLTGTEEVYQLRPSFLMPYLIARTDEVEKPLYLRHWGVPYEALAYVFGRDQMFWYRAEMALGRPSLVGSTVKSPQKLPEHLVADEKHTWSEGEKLYVPVTVAQGCIVGASVAPCASADALEAAYGEFAAEARQVDCSYSPKSVCTDGWDETQTAWKRLFPFISLILCFLHSVLKIKERTTRKDPLRKVLVDKLWNLYEAKTKRSFVQRVRRIREWATDHLVEGLLRDTVLRICSKKELFARAYDFVRPHRTSNAVDRLINHLDRRLYAMRYFHGTIESARLAVRAMALSWNFHPYGARMRSEDGARRSPFHDLNGFEYHSNWLHNLLIAASMGGCRT